MAYIENLITIQQQVSNHLLLFHLLSCKYQCKELYLVLPKYGVIPFEFRTLKKGHTEARRAQRFYKAEIVRHRGTVGAWRNQRIFASVVNALVYFITKQWFARFLKMFITKVISNTYTTPLSLFVPSAPP